MGQGVRLASGALKGGSALQQRNDAWSTNSRAPLIFSNFI